MTDFNPVWAALSRGEYAVVVGVARHALASEPRQREALLLLAAASFETNDLAAAVSAYQQLTVIEPDRPAHWQNLGTAQREAGDLPAALSSFEQALARGAGDRDFHLNFGLLLWDLFEVDRARAHLETAYALDADDAACALAYGGLCCQTVRQQLAVAVLGRWRKWRTLAEAQLPELGAWLLELGEIAEAEAVLRLARTLDPESLLVQIRLVGLLERLNRLDEAEALLASLPLESTDADRQFEQQAIAAQLAQRRGLHAEAASIRRSLLSQSEAQADRPELHFSLASNLDSLGDHEAAYAAMQAAHAAQMQHLRRYTPGAVLQPEPLRIANFSCDPADVSRWQRPPPDLVRPDPVFVVGFPRSGTTLLEQMLDAHPGLCSMDERPFLNLAISDIQALDVSYPEQLAMLSVEQLAQVREAYWRRVANKVTLPAGTRLVDKNPLNMLRLPAIFRLFPDARVILVIRHPCDVLLSCFMQHFRAPEFAVLCRSLDSLSEGYCKSFEFWYQQRTLLPAAQVLELRYESFVQDVEATARQLTAFIGLPWDERLLDPAGHAQRRGYISTPSYAQVTKPVNRNAVGRWHRYAAPFAPLMPRLAPWLARWGYEGLDGQSR